MPFKQLLKEYHYCMILDLKVGQLVIYPSNFRQQITNICKHHDYELAYEKLLSYEAASININTEIKSLPFSEVHIFTLLPTKMTKGLYHYASHLKPEHFKTLMQKHAEELSTNRLIPC